MSASQGLTALEAAHEALAAIKERRRLVLACVILLPVLAIAFNAVRTEYEARAELTFTPLNENQTLVGLGIPTQSVPTADQLLTDPILSEVNSRLALKETVGALRSRLEVRQDHGDRQVTLIGQASSPNDAVNLVNRWATSFVDSRNRLLAERFASVRGSLAATYGRATNRADRRTLKSRIDQIDSVRAASRGDTTVSQSAAGSPKPMRRFNELVALIAGLVIGVALALSLAIFDRRVRTPALAAANLGLPLLGVLPPRGRARDALEAAIRIQSKLAVRNGRPTPAVLMVTSPKTLAERGWAAEQIARAYADSGCRVAMVRWRDDGDDVVKPDRDVSESGVHVESVSGRWSALEERLRQLGTHVDITVVDAPAMLSSGDALVASQRLPEWILCATLGVTRGDEVEAVKRELSELQTRPVGLVVIEGQRDD